MNFARVNFVRTAMRLIQRFGHRIRGKKGGGLRGGMGLVFSYLFLSVQSLLFILSVGKNDVLTGEERRFQITLLVAQELVPVLCAALYVPLLPSVKSLGYQRPCSTKSREKRNQQGEGRTDLHSPRSALQRPRVSAWARLEFCSPFLP